MQWKTPVEFDFPIYINGDGVQMFMSYEHCVLVTTKLLVAIDDVS